LTVDTSLVSKSEQSEKLPNTVAFFYESDTIESDTMANLWTPCELKNVEERPNESESKKNSLFGGTPIKQDKPELSASFYAERNPAKQAQPHSF
jgi:hypothetical protein